MNPIRLAAALLLAALSAICFQGTHQPAFVAAIHRHAPGDDRFFVRPPSNGQFSAGGVVARLLIMLAYDIQESQIAGGEGWVQTDKWDIAAKSDTPGPYRAEDTRRMLRTLLADRFSLRVHWETQDRSSYVLIPSKGGPKLPEAKEPDSTNVHVSGNSIALDGGEISRFTQLLSGALGKPVVDRTGLSGSYDIHLQWDDSPAPGGGMIGLASPAAPDPNHGSIFTEIERQLGLRLVSEKAQVEVLVIDHIEPASAN